jgi:hypothetical protein
MSTFNNLGFDTLYIGGTLFDLSTFRGPPGPETTKNIGPVGNNGNDDGFVFQTINTTPAITVVTLPDAKDASYDALVVKCNGVLTNVNNVSVGELKSIKIETFGQKIHMGTLYNNNMPQVMRFKKFTLYNVEIDGVMLETYSSWRI